MGTCSDGDIDRDLVIINPCLLMSVFQTHPPIHQLSSAMPRAVSQLLARCYVVAKVYKVLHICDTVPPCRAHVHMFSIILFLRVRENNHTVARKD